MIQILQKCGLHNPRVNGCKKGWYLTQEKKLETTQDFQVNITCYKKSVYDNILRAHAGKPNDKVDIK